MIASLLALPAELQTLVYSFLPDLDDALHLSQTSQVLRCLYTTHGRKIDRNIIVNVSSPLALYVPANTLAQTSSHVFEYDLCLSKFADANKTLGALLCKNKPGNYTIPQEERPAGSTYIDCISAKWTDSTLTDQEVRDVATRWRYLGLLRNLYVDQRLLGEYESFRTQLASMPRGKGGFVVVEPGITSPSASCSQFAPTPLKHSEFKASFYRSLCLHSVAISSLRLAKACRDQSRNDSYPPNAVGDKIAEHTIRAWNKSIITMGGCPTEPSQVEKIRSLELVDFVYAFVLKKVIPQEKLEFWTLQDSEYWEYGPSDLVTWKDREDLWHSFLDDCRWALQPWDIVDLICNKSWCAESEYPQDTSLYMRMRGMLDWGADGDMDWFSSFTRFSMIDALRPDERPIPWTEREIPSWWDHVRASTSSPFISKSESS